MESLHAITVLISGRGSNLASLMKDAKNYRICGVISNRSEALGLKIAADAGIPAFSFPRENYSSIAQQKEAIFNQVHKLSPDLVALAGYMQIVEPNFVAAFLGRMVNIHPALLPKFPGLDTHQRALAAGEKEHGCSVHYVDQGVDTGQVIAQAACPVLKSDSSETLAARVLTQEHRLYPWVVNSIAAGDISLQNGQVVISALARQTAQQEGFIIP